MNIRLQKQGNGYPILLLHGWGFNHKIWHPIVEDLAQSNTVYSVDLPGFGETPLVDYMVFFENLLSRLPANFAVIGWSMGGAVATKFAYLFPDKISHLINIASSPYFVAADNWPGIKAYVLDDFYKRLAKFPVKTMREFMRLQCPKLVIENEMMSTNLDGLYAGLEILKTWDLRLELTVIHCPVLYLLGRLDAIIPNQTSLALTEHYDNLVCNMHPKASHAIHWSYPNWVIKHIEDFIA